MNLSCTHRNKSHPCSLKAKDTVGDVQDVAAAGEGGAHVGLLLDNPIQLPKGGQRGRAHPHDEVLVDEAVVLRIRVQLVHGLPPVHRLVCA